MVPALQASEEIDRLLPGPALAMLASAQAVKLRTFSPADRDCVREDQSQRLRYDDGRDGFHSVRLSRLARRAERVFSGGSGTMLALLAPTVSAKSDAVEPTFARPLWRGRRVPTSYNFALGAFSLATSSVRRALTTRSNWDSNFAWSLSQPVKSAVSRDVRCSSFQALKPCLFRLRA